MRFSTFWRTLSGWGLGLLMTALLIPVTLLAWLLDPFRFRFVSPLVSFWGRFIMWACFIPIKVTGTENLKGLDAAVFVSNHQSMLDIFMLLGYIPRTASFLAKRQVIYIPIIGWLMILFGHIRVDRTSPKAALKSVDRCIAAIRKGRSIYVFPEGTRTDHGHISPFKSGSLKIPLRTGAPVVPVTIAGAHKVMAKKTFAVNKNTIALHIGKPIPTDHLDIKDFKAFVREVEEKVRDAFKELNKTWPDTAPDQEPLR